VPVKTDCAFCNGTRKQPPPRLSETVLFESEHFLAWPSLGALVEGWVLVLPKMHCLALGSLSPSLHAELDEFRNKVKGKLASAYGPVASFEHGPSACEQAAGCGVDHAHLHMVPFGNDLLGPAKELLPADVACRRVSSIFDGSIDLRAGRSYIYLEEVNGCQWTLTSARIPSQLIRRVIAGYLGHPNRFDWKADWRLATVEATVRRLKPFRSGHL
jgi:ATP adenylyltransferase